MRTLMTIMVFVLTLSAHADNTPCGGGRCTDGTAQAADMSIADHVNFIRISLNVAKVAELAGSQAQKENYALACFHIGALSNQVTGKAMTTLIKFCFNTPDSRQVSLDAALQAAESLPTSKQ